MIMESDVWKNVSNIYYKSVKDNSTMCQDCFVEGVTALNSKKIKNGTRSNFTTTGNMSEMLEETLSGETLIGLIFLYSITTFLSIAGNVLVVIVFVKGRRCKTDLRLFLINLAAADLIMATFCMPFTFADVILGQWVFSKPMCPIVLFMQLLSVCASVFTNMAIGTDRFMAVSFPLHSRITYKRAKYVIVCVWFASVSLSIVQLFVGRTIEIYPGVIKCNERWPLENSRRIYTIFILLLTYILPLVILSFTYSIVIILLWKRTTPGNKHHHRDIHQLRSKIKIVKMLVIVVAMFGICWLPIHVFTMVIDFNPELLQYESKEQEHLFMVLFLSAHWLAMSNSFANPIIYGFTNESFRADLVVLLHRWFPCCGCLKSIMTRTYSLSNYDSNIYRRQTTFRQSVTNNNTSSPGPGQLFLKKPSSYRLSFHNGRVGSGSSTRGSGFKKN
ncbi:hypothetical protein KUTeg_003667, partial [Tegillarca granosa]